MSFLARLFGRSAGSAPASSGTVFWLYVRCNRCSEKIRIRINRATDAQQEYDDGGRLTHYSLRKEILGNQCANLMAVELQLDARGRLIGQEAEHCVIITEQDYQSE